MQRRRSDRQPAQHGSACKNDGCCGLAGLEEIGKHAVTNMLLTIASTAPDLALCLQHDFFWRDAPVMGMQ